LVADWFFFPNIEPERQDEAIRAFIERVAIPQEVERYSYEVLKSYIRDALHRGTDHWDFCSPDDIEANAKSKEYHLGIARKLYRESITLPDLEGEYPGDAPFKWSEPMPTSISLPDDAE